MSTQGKNYTLITGASVGIGFELAKLFAKDKHNLILVSRSQQDLETAANQLRQEGIEVKVMAVDLFDWKNCETLYNDVKAQGVNVNILVNNAGQGQYGKFLETDFDREHDIIHLNIVSLVYLTKLFAKDMAEQGEGKILNVSSIASRTPGPWQSVYHATKAFVQSFSEAIRHEFKENNIVVSALLPGATDTDFFAKADMLESKAVQDPDKLSDPADVAKDGYEALMSGKDHVVSGFMNKVQTAMAAVSPEPMLAAQVDKQQKPVNEESK